MTHHTHTVYNIRIYVQYGHTVGLYSCILPSNALFSALTGGHFECDSTLYPPPPAGADPTANTRTCTAVGGGHFKCDATLHPPPPPRARTPQRIHASAQTWVAAILKKRACKSEKNDSHQP